MPKSITGMWVKHVWDTTQVKYKAVLKNWFKGTGGGSGDRTLVEGRSDGKLDKYQIDVNTYDHTDIKIRPAVLFQGYCRDKVPYLTVINLWDEKVDFLLSSRHDPIKIGIREPGMDDGASANFQAAVSPKMKKKGKNIQATTSSLEDMMKNLIDLCNRDTQSQVASMISNDNIIEVSLPMDKLPMT